MAATKKSPKKRAVTKAAPAKATLVTGLTFLFTILSLIFAGVAWYYYI